MSRCQCHFEMPGHCPGPAACPMCQPDPPDDPAYLLALWMGAKDTERATQLVHWLLDQAGLNELPADAILGQLTGCRHEELMMTDYLDKRDR